MDVNRFTLTFCPIHDYIFDDYKEDDFIDKLIATAEAELGYLEKKSNKNLDDKTANAGSNNYTKYNRDLKAWTGVGSISAQWCQAFVDWVFITAFGLEAA